MSKSAIVAIGTASVIAIAIIFGLFALASKSTPALPNTLDSTRDHAMSSPNSTEIKKVPSLLPGMDSTPALAAGAVPDAGKPLDDTSLLSKIRELEGSDPPLTLKLAREAISRFPNSPNAPEFQWNIVKALFNMGRGDDAMNEARIMVSKYPGNSFTGDVEHHLLHPQPNSSDMP